MTATTAPASFQQHDFDNHMRVALEHAVYEAKDKEREALQRALNGEGGETQEPLTQELADDVNNDLDGLPDGLGSHFRVFFASRHQHVTSHKEVVDSLASQAQNRQITLDEFTQRVKASNEDLVDKLSYGYSHLHAQIEAWFKVNSFPIPENYEEVPGGRGDIAGWIEGILAPFRLILKTIGYIVKAIAWGIKLLGDLVSIIGSAIEAVGKAIQAVGQWIKGVGDFLDSLF